MKDPSRNHRRDLQFEIRIIQGDGKPRQEEEEEEEQNVGLADAENFPYKFLGLSFDMSLLLSFKALTFFCQAVIQCLRL